MRRPVALQAVTLDVARFIGVSKIFVTPSGMVPALENVSFSIRPGEFVCLVGASGCGKTTALRMMAALDYPSSGMVCLDGTPLRAPSDQIGFVFQQPNLLPWRSILQNVILPLTVKKTGPQKEAEARGMKMLEMVGLADFAGHYPRELSGGMQQRAGIVRALINDPELLLMDEPFGALDTITREELNLELLRIWEQSGKTVMFVTHNIAEAVFLADRVYVMTPRPGRIAAEVDVPFGRPRTMALLHDVEFQDVVAEVRRAI